MTRVTPWALWALAASALLAGCAAPPPGARTDEPVAAASVPIAASAPATAASAVVPPVAAAVDAPIPPVAVAPPEPVYDPVAAEAARLAATDDLRAHRRVAQAGSPDSSLWDRIRAGFALNDLDGDLVRRWEEHYASQPDYVARMTERGSRYLFHIVEEVEARGLPMEIALLPFIESAFNPQAQSSARAAGMWQFMPATGRVFDLKQNAFRDDRRDVLASTRAALDFLQSLHARFGDWHLALAAYNWGPGNVSRAVSRNRAVGSATDYQSLRMPAETRNYVPKLQAIKNIVARPVVYGLNLPPLANHPYFLVVAIERDIDVALAAELAGMSEEAFRQFNPQHNKPVILAAGTPQVLLPYDEANRFVREIARHRGPLASWTAWVAPRTLKTADVARMVGMSEPALRDVNRIPARMLVRTGSILVVPRPASRQADVAEHLADGGAVLLAPEPSALRRVVLKVGRKGDTVAGVARRYGLSSAQVAQWNGVKADARFRPGARVVVMLPKKGARVAAGGGRSAKQPVRPRTAKTARPRASP